MNCWKTLKRYRRSSGRNRKLSDCRSSSGILTLVHIGGITIGIDVVIAGVRTAVPSVRGVGHKHNSQTDKKRVCFPGTERGVNGKEVKGSEMEIECDETKLETLQNVWKQSVKRTHEGNRVVRAQEKKKKEEEEERREEEESREGCFLFHNKSVDAPINSQQMHCLRGRLEESSLGDCERIVYPSFPSTASLPKAFDERAIHDWAPTICEEVSILDRDYPQWGG